MTDETRSDRPEPRLDPLRELSENVRTKFFVKGRWVEPATDAQQLTLISPDSETPFLSVPAAGRSDIDFAVDAAREAFDKGPWPRLSPAERVQRVRRLRDELESRLPLMQRSWTAQIGIPTTLAKHVVHEATDSYDFFIDLAAKFPWGEDRPLWRAPGRASVVLEPVGVCALVTPWNHPAGMVAFKTAPALIAGCTMIVKPSPETPLEALIFAEAVEAAGLPEGVVNVLPADREVSDYLIRKPEIDKVSFTGSSAVGKHIASVCGLRMARASMELGGKSAAIILDDADLGKVMATLSRFCLAISGQGCFLLTRILVPRARAGAVLDMFLEMIASLTVGDPWDPRTKLGPVASKRQYDRIMEYIDIGKREGARLVAGGGRSADHSRGYFIEPTVFADVSPNMRIAREEIFGPVIAFMTYDGEEEAIEIANATEYGLNAAIFSEDETRAVQLARRIRSGSVGINRTGPNMGVPFGGFKQSGVGREHGREALSGFLEPKAIVFP